MKVTRTMNPLPFQDLEPKRFEDLIRQLIYDFRDWQKLEATGRSGSDEGFDARALERNPTNEVDNEEENVSLAQNKFWLIQCKREKTISSAKLLSHLKQLNIPADQPLYGMIFAAACDFSKKTRDTFHVWCGENNISESIIWGKGELEDMLFQPKNDNLLFAYFGISLSIRKRTAASKLRSGIANKKKLKHALSSNDNIIIRNPDIDDYPEPLNKNDDVTWVLCEYECLTYRGLMVRIKSSPAYFNYQTEEWDAANLAFKYPEEYNINNNLNEENEKLLQNAYSEWNSLESGRSWLHYYRFIHYEDIIAIDDTCEDTYFDGVQIFVPYYPDYGPFDDSEELLIISQGFNFQGGQVIDNEKRIVKFNEKIRKNIDRKN